MSLVSLTPHRIPSAPSTSSTSTSSSNNTSSNQQHQARTAQQQDPTFSMLNAFPPASFDSSNLSAATSTVHPESTVHGSQYGDPMPIAADDFMLAPMYAVDNPGFWDHGMMPGFSWGPARVSHGRCRSTHSSMTRCSWAVCSIKMVPMDRGREYQGGHLDGMVIW
jgi:hypothetical protein